MAIEKPYWIINSQRRDYIPKATNSTRISVGYVFRSKWFVGSVEVLSLDEAQNSLKVRITRSEEHSHEEDWNLEHTIQGFDRGDYFK